MTWRRFDRLCRSNSQFDFSGDGNKQVKPNIGVGMHAADGARLEFHPRDTNFSAVYLSYRVDPWVRGVGRTGSLGGYV